MANINKIQVENVLYDIEDTTARSSAVTMSVGADDTVSLSSASAGTSVTVPSITNFGDPSELENDVVTEINDLKSQINNISMYVEGDTLYVTTNIVDGSEVSY